MNLAKMAAAAALAIAAIPGTAFAQDVAAGATVYGPEGNVVGTVESVADGVVTLDTGTHKAPLPTNAFGTSDRGPTITVTKAQLDDMMAQQVAAANAKRDAALIEGAAVIAADKQPLGVVKSIDGDAVIVEATDGPVELKREHFAVDATGALMALFTVDQIKAAAATAAQASAAGATAEATASTDATAAGSNAQ